jgi:hypothetical protein
MIDNRPGVDLELVRQQWQDGSRRVERTRSDPARYAHLHGLVEVLISELRRRIGQTFTLAELAEAYAGADDWARFVLDEAEPEDSPPAEVSTVADAAFHTYARGALDYVP